MNMDYLQNQYTAKFLYIQAYSSSVLTDLHLSTGLVTHFLLVGTHGPLEEKVYSYGAPQGKKQEHYHHGA